MMLRVAEQAHRTDTGRQRNANEDAYFARGPLFAVADGMGGAQAGEVASRMAAESFEPVRARRGIAGGLPARDRQDGQPPHPPSRPGRLLALGNGDHAHRRPGRGRRGQLRPRGRQPRLPVPRRRAEAPDLRSLAGRGAPPPGPPDRRAGRGPPAALDHHPGAGARARGRGGHDDLPGAARGRLPAVLRRPDDDGPRRIGSRRRWPIPRASTTPSRAWSARRTRPAAETTSPWSPSGWRRPRRRPRRRSNRR